MFAFDLKRNGFLSAISFSGFALIQTAFTYDRRQFSFVKLFRQANVMFGEDRKPSMIA